MTRAFVLIFASLISFQSISETLTLDYSSFYSHVRKLDDEETPGLRFAFGFKHIHQGRLCEIEKAVIQTQKKDIPLTITPEYRFTVPSEKALKMAKAVVMVELGDKANWCDMSVQLETKPEQLKSVYEAQDTKALLTQYRAFFDKMGGLMSFLMPSVDGLKFHFEDQLNTDLKDSSLAITNGVLVLSETQIENGLELSLPAIPKRITARMDNEK